MNRQQSKSKIGKAGRLALCACLVWPAAREGRAVDPLYETWNLEVLSQIGGGRGQAVSVAGDYAYLCLGCNVVIFDVSGPAPTHPIGRVLLPHVADIHVTGNLAFVATGNGLGIVDVTDPRNPRILSEYAEEYGANRVFAADNRVYYTTRVSTWPWPLVLRIVDLSNPSVPALAGSYPVPHHPPVKLTVVGDIAYVGGVEMFLIDVSDPSSPTLAGSVDFDEISAVRVVNQRLYVAGERAGMYALHIFDVGDPSSPALLGIGNMGGLFADGMDVRGNLAYVVEELGDGLQIIDVSDPSSPSLRGSIESAGHSVDVTVVGDRAYCAALGGLQVVDVADSFSPAPSSKYEEPISCWGIEERDGLANVAYSIQGPLGGNTFAVVDLSDPRVPQPVGFTHASNFPRRVIARPGVSYVWPLGSGVLAIDTTDPTSPTVLATLGPPASVHRRLQTFGSLLFYCDSESNFHIYDVADPSSPTLRYRREDSGVYGFHVTDRGVYVVGRIGMELLDITDPSSPVVRGANGFGGLDIRVVGDIAYVTRDGLHVLDVADVNSPVRLGFYETRANQIEAAQGWVCVYKQLGSRQPVIEVLDVRTPSSPERIGFFRLGSISYNGYIGEVSISGDRIYAATAWEGAWVLRFPQAQQMLRAASRPEWRLYR